MPSIYLGTLVFSYLLEFVQTYLMQWTGQKVMFDMRSQIFRHIQSMHVSFFDRNPVGRLVTRLTSDVDALNEMFTSGVFAIFEDVFVLVLIVAIMLRMNWWLALIAFAVLPLILVVTRVFRKHVRDSYRRIRSAIARINASTQEHVSGMSVVQLFNREQRSYEEFEAVNRQHMVAFKDAILAYALYYPAVELLSSVAIALVIWLGGFGVLRNAVSIGVLVAFIQYSQRFFRPIQDLSEKYNILQAAMAASERVFKLLDTPAELQSPAAPRACDGSGRIEFRHVWFTYQKLDEQQLARIQQAEGTEADPRGLSGGGVDSQGRVVRDRARPDGGHRGPHRRRQDHHHRPDDALLRDSARQRADQWRGRSRTGCHGVAAPFRGGAAGSVPVHRDHRREHSPGFGLDHRRADEGRGR